MLQSKFQVIVPDRGQLPPAPHGNLMREVIFSPLHTEDTEVQKVTDSPQDMKLLSGTK